MSAPNPTFGPGTARPRPATPGVGEGATRSADAASIDAAMESVEICGVRIENLTTDEACRRMRGLIERHATRARAVYIVNAHTINLACDQPAFRDVLNGADAVFGDGTGVRWAARLKGTRMRANLVGTDLVPHFMSEPSARQYRYYLLGGRDPIVQAAANHVGRAYGVTMAGWHHGHFAAGDNAAVVDRINASGADVLFVAMGNPVQEQWIHDNRARLQVRLCIGVGGLVDHWGGALRRAPGWVRHWGLEWTQIMLQQPHKWRRYLIGNPKFLWRVTRDHGGYRREPRAERSRSSAESRPTVASRSAVKTNLKVLAISVAISLVLLEIIARFVVPAPLPWRFPQVRYRADPALIFALAPNQRAFTADKLVTINARGLRGPLVPYDRDPKRRRLLFLGDSIVFGFGVSDDDLASNRVARMLSGHNAVVDAINAGVPAYNTDQEIAYLEQEGVRYRPDWVIVGVCWNDIHEKTGVTVDALGRLTDESGAPGKVTDLLDTPTVYALRNAVKQSRLLYTGMQAWRALDGLREPTTDMRTRAEVLDGHEYSELELGWRRMEEAVHRLRVAADKYGFRPLLVTFPIPLTIAEPHPDSSYPKRVAEMAERERVAFRDLAPAFQREYRGYESLFIPWDGDHPNGRGHIVAAREIAHFLRHAR